MDDAETLMALREHIITLVEIATNLDILDIVFKLLSR